ncbi:MAG: cell division protein SepF [Anaeroplasma sp.]
MIFKKKKDPYADALYDLNESAKSADKLVIKKMIDDDNLARDLVLLLKDDNPLVLNFQDLDEAAGNKMLAFFIGATVALDGKTIQINEFTYLFAKKSDFLDGSLKQFIANLPSR